MAYESSPDVAERSSARSGGLAAVALALGIAYSPGASAQVGRLFLAVPVDSNLAIVTYNGSRSNTWVDEAIADPATESRSQTGSLLYARIMDVFGRTGGPGISIPYSSLLSYDRATDAVTTDASGFADLALTFDVNFFGAPAMTPEQFKNFTPVTYSGLHLTLGTPWGSYDRDAATNIGSNRWSYKALVNYSITNDAGRTWWDFYPSVRFFGANDEYAGDRRLTQRPVYAIEGHYSWTVATRTWLSAGLIGSTGGALKVDGARVGGSQDTLRLALGGGFPSWPGGVVIVGYNRTLVRSDDAARVNNYMLQLIHKF